LPLPASPWNILVRNSLSRELLDVSLLAELMSAILTRGRDESEGLFCCLLWLYWIGGSMLCRLLRNGPVSWL